MKQATIEMIRTALAVDETVGAVEREAVLEACRGKAPQPVQSMRKLRMREAAALLQVSTLTVTKYLNRGILRGIKPSERWTGVFEQSVLDLMKEGRTKTTVCAAAGLPGSCSSQLLPAAGSQGGAGE